jgi:hypothetical protein
VVEWVPVCAPSLAPSVAPVMVSDTYSAASATAFLPFSSTSAADSVQVFCALSWPFCTWSPTFWVKDLSCSGVRADAVLSKPSVTVSLALSKVVFWESGVTDSWILVEKSFLPASVIVYLYLLVVFGGSERERIIELNGY